MNGADAPTAKPDRQVPGDNDRKKVRCRFDIYVMSAALANLRLTGYSGETSFKFGPSKDDIRVHTADYKLKPDPTPGSVFGKTIVFGPPDQGIHIYNSDQERLSQDCGAQVSVRLWAQADSGLGGEYTTFEFACDGKDHEFPVQVYVSDHFHLGIGIGYFYGLSFKVITKCL